MFKFKTGIALIAIAVATCLQVPAVYAEDIQPPRTSGEGDQIIQDIAEELTGSSGGSGYSGSIGSRPSSEAGSPIVLAPVTGGVLQPNRNSAQAPSAAPAQSTMERNSDNSTTVLAASALVAGSLMIGATMVLESQRRQRRRHHRSH